MIRPLAMAVMTAGLVACGGGPEAQFAEYASRVARTLDQAIDRPAHTVLPAFPRPRDQAVDQPDVRLALRDAWAVRECMGQLIAMRNSGLGKVMQASQRLAYESEFGVQAQQCLQQLGGDVGEQADDQREVLAAIIARKRGAVRTAAQAFVLRDPQLAEFWRLPARPLPADAPPVRADALSQIAEQIQRAVGGDVVDTQALEAQLQALQGSSGIGQIVQSEAMAVAWLNAITAAIHARLDRRPVCYQGQATPDARVLQAIFASVYVGQVQPWLAQVQKAAQAARPPAQNMLALLADDLGAAMQAYRTVVVETGPGSSQAVFLAATQAHAKAWQRLLAQCGMMPTR